MPVEPLPCDPGNGPGPGAVEPCCAPGITSTPMCLAGGDPIVVVLSAPCGECDGDTAAPTVTGWLDPASGEFTAGPPPEGAGPCAAEACPTTADIVPRCDATPDGECLPMLRHLLRDCDGAVLEVVDTGPDGITPYVPAGEVTDCGSCAPCVPVQQCPQLVGMSGPDAWVMPDGCESVTVTVARGPVGITDCTGAETTVNEAGVTVTWSAPASGDPCAPGALCAPLTVVAVEEQSAVYITYLSPCGDAS